MNNMNSTYTVHISGSREKDWSVTIHKHHLSLTANIFNSSNKTDHYISTNYTREIRLINDSLAHWGRPHYTVTFVSTTKIPWKYSQWFVGFALFSFLSLPHLWICFDPVLSLHRKPQFHWSGGSLLWQIRRQNWYSLKGQKRFWLPFPSPLPTFPLYEGTNTCFFLDIKNKSL